MSVSATRPSVLRLQPSLIRKLANAAMGREDVIPLWFGEPDLPTPQFIRDVAKAALYFSCEDSAGITGTSLVVDAGYTATAEWKTDGQTRFME